MNNNDKINILKEAAGLYYDNELRNKQQEQLNIKEFKKYYIEYEEITDWLESLRNILDLESAAAVLRK